MILPVANHPGPGTDILLCSVPLSLTWSLTGVSWPIPAASQGTRLAPPKRGGEVIHGPEPRTHRKQPNGPDEFVARGWSKLVTPEERTPPCQSFSSTSSPRSTATHRERDGPGSGASRARSTSLGSASSLRSLT